MVSDEQGVASVGHVVGPRLHHFVHGQFFARRCVDPAVGPVPVEGARDVARAEVVQSMALGRVGLSQVVRERPHVAGVTGGEGLQRAAGANRAELAVIAYGDQFRPRGLHRRQQLPDVGVRGHSPFVQDQDMARAERFTAVLDAPGERRHRTGGDAGAFAEGLCRLARSRRPEDLVAGGFEAFPHGRQGARLARAGNPDDQVQGMAGSEQALGHFGLSLGETDASGQLHLADGRNCGLSSTRGPALSASTSASSAMRRSSSTTQAAAQTGSRARETAGQRHRLLVGKHLVNGLSRNETGRPCR